MVRRAAPWLTQRYRYSHAHVELHFFRVFEWDGVPVGHDGQAFSWQPAAHIDVEPLLPANTRILRALRLPPIYGITMASDIGEAAFLARVDAALGAGLMMLELREKDWPAVRQRALADALIARARPRGAKVLLNGNADHARQWGCDGVHLSSAALEATQSRPLADDLLCAASCHTRAEIVDAARLGLDFAVLGPVLPTPSHPTATLLGWEGFASIAAEAPLPIFALGGLSIDDLPTAIAHGAHGVALRRAAWPDRRDYPRPLGTSPGADP